MPKHYRITATLTHPANELPESRHILLGEVDEATFTAGDANKLLEDAASECLHSRNLLVHPLLAAFETAGIMLFGRTLKNEPDAVKEGVKIWYQVTQSAC